MNSEIKPVFYVDGTTLRCRTMDDISDESVLYYRRGDKVHDTDVALYPESVIEALKNRISELEKEDEISDGTIKLCSTILAKIAITLKGEPMELARHSYHDLPELVAVLHLENELNKVQMQEMLTAMRRAVLALAFAAESSAAMKDDYNALSAAIDKVAEANKGEKS